MNWKQAIFAILFALYWIRRVMKLLKGKGEMKAAVYDKDSPSGIKVITDAVKPSRTNNTSVLVKVMATGVNPVDAKHVIGDKLP
jgi:hypothetical protein